MPAQWLSFRDLDPKFPSAPMETLRPPRGPGGLYGQGPVSGQVDKLSHAQGGLVASDFRCRPARHLGLLNAAGGARTRPNGEKAEFGPLNAIDLSRKLELAARVRENSEDGINR